MDLGWCHLRKDGEWSRFLFSWAQDAKVRSAVCQQLLCSAPPVPRNKHKYPAHGPKVPKFKAVFKKEQRSFTEVFALD